MNSTAALLTAWMPRQRWCSAKDRTPSLRIVASWHLPDPFVDDGAPSVRVQTLLVADDSAKPTALYQVPVVERPTSSVDVGAEHIIGSLRAGVSLVDGAFDPAYTEALPRLVTRGGEGAGEGARAVGVPSASVPDATPYVAEVLSGEQSNTSIIYRAAGAPPLICKVFRQLHPGLNPDIELQTALAGAGSPFVPRAIGSVSGTWPDPAGGTLPLEGSLAFAQEFLPGVEDARRVALRAATEGVDFTEAARELGVATAGVHVSLAELFGTGAGTAEDHDLISASWRRRLDIAIAEVPELAEAREAIEAVYERATLTDWPGLQRVHGDYHLGQAILTPERGWVLLDFEGEPMRPMAERVRPDLALRDVAGLLRSFDYIAGSLMIEHPDQEPEPALEWARAARLAFLEGYAAASGVYLSAHRPLLDALELDKAVYEAIYESRNRPDWIAIPLTAIRRLVSR
ncbi:maltokinase N-terminal cap-like domain-containing protein [Microbacterium hydrocarbonoxydans]|uniref:maltokinase N-terminal cap-like domain-containing protein n=1 Tax=Microbacterium hydrocarbonoxydans TaxID=273678 RepID=UPI0013DC311A|nr:phosphotransferase [Microbacterium hydrocarbonoxydans]